MDITIASNKKMVCISKTERIKILGRKEKDKVYLNEFVWTTFDWPHSIPQSNEPL